ncbi:hypothetical protein [Thermostaphylospora chromogena]|uniref:hypothetical protein n=1 Tax=Thermostaphylospora chromogena TaxID=35622 RepID=UPI001F613954|nr:hypothetical protein [Thermostaphylospora chromogena]
MRGRAFETGQRILIGRRYVVVDDGYDHLRVLVNDRRAPRSRRRDPRYRPRAENVMTADVIVVGFGPVGQLTTALLAGTADV